jgi:hypothetical protein
VKGAETSPVQVRCKSGEKIEEKKRRKVFSAVQKKKEQQKKIKTIEA